MEQLDLVLVGLPGARLDQGSQLPGRNDIAIHARGGASYSSCALVWKAPLLNRVHILEDLGTDRSIFAKIDNGSRGDLWLITIYLPAGKDSEAQQRWHHELNIVEQGLETLRQQGIHPTTHEIIIMGDMNHEPSSIKATSHEGSNKEDHWKAFVSRWQLVDYNPPLLDGSIHTVKLPLRKRSVQVHIGATHHCRGQSRGLDRVLASRGAIQELRIHNGVHCSSCELCHDTPGEQGAQTSSCTWKLCTEYTWGDHFLLDFSVATSISDQAHWGCISMPKWWHDRIHWQKAVNAALPATRELTRLIMNVASTGSAKAACRKLTTAQATWVGDAVAWASATLGAIMLQGWVLVQGTNTAHPHNHTPTPDRQDPTWLHQLAAAAARGEAHTELVHRSFRMLRPPRTRPAPVMQPTCPATVPQSQHAGWLALVAQQSIWQQPYDQSFHDSVTRDVRTRVGQAWQHKGMGTHDAPWSQQEMCVVQQSWHPSLATTPDLLPRILFQLGDHSWDALVWATMLLTAPDCLAIRPELWRSACAVPLHKKGSTDVYGNFRMIMVKCLFGLMQEGLFFQRLRSVIRANIRPGQSGYIRDVGDAHLLLHCTTAAFLHSRRTLWSVPGDFAKAFPRTWRARIIQQVATGPAIADGMLSLLNSMLKKDNIHVNVDGVGVVQQFEGIPEGGTLGPLLYPSLIDTLTRELEARGLGVGLDPAIPPIWSGYVWRGLGTPIPNLVEELCRRLRSANSLPGACAHPGDNLCPCAQPPHPPWRAAEQLLPSRTHRAQRGMGGVAVHEVALHTVPTRGRYSSSFPKGVAGTVESHCREPLPSCQLLLVASLLPAKDSCMWSMFYAMRSAAHASCEVFGLRCTMPPAVRGSGRGGVRFSARHPPPPPRCGGVCPHAPTSHCRRRPTSLHCSRHVLPVSRS